MASLIRFLALACAFWLSSACFITNCPPGGKRTPAHSKPQASRQCAVCGPNGQGRCFGPELCCGPEIGCYMRTRESAPCRAENLFPVQCENRARACAVERSGKCASAGICCTEDSCSSDLSCRPSPKEMAAASRGQRPQMTSAGSDLASFFEEVVENMAPLSVSEA